MSGSENDIDLSKKKAVAGIDFNTLSLPVKRRLALMTDLEIASYFAPAGTGRQNFDTPKFIKTEAEDVIANGNASIVLGVDRPGNKLSSAFGTHCAAIDIVAGRLGAYATSKANDGEDIYVNPNFKLDAARIYISQKSDLDNYFGLEKGKVGSTDNKNPRSGVGIKADVVRIIGRENIKLVTRTDNRNAQAGETSNLNQGIYGIDLMAMNGDGGQQPLVKGENLVECLVDMAEAIASLRGLFENFLEYNSIVNKALMTHTHHSPFFGIPTSPSMQVIPTALNFEINNTINTTIPTLLQHMMESTNIVSTYLEAGGGLTSKKYILSKFNSTN